MMVEALRQDKRVGITATSHKVISKLDKVCAAAREFNVDVHGVQKALASQRCASKTIKATNDAGRVSGALAEDEIQLAAGTAWLWCRDDMIESVDLLFIDEAGQFSLANAPAVARVGTVDKFQGQEPPIVIYSMATEAPRGMRFLFSARSTTSLPRSSSIGAYTSPRDAAAPRRISPRLAYQTSTTENIFSCDGTSHRPSRTTPAAG